MKYEKVVIKQIPTQSSALFGLNKYNRSKMPGVLDSFPATLGPDGRYITGIDENAYEIQLIQDKEERAKISTERKELREFLEKFTGKDLTASSSFWDTFRVQIASNQEPTLNRVNPMDVISYHILISNGYAAPDKVSAAEPEYLNCRYYCHVEERAESEDVSTFKKRDIARAELVKLSENQDHLLLVLDYLSCRVKKGMKEDTLYRIASEYINDKDSENIKRFSKAAKLDAEELQYKIVIDKAIKRKIIKRNGEYFQRGQVTLGRTPTEVYANLKKPDNAGEFFSIQEELESE